MQGQRSWQVRILPCNWDNKTGLALNFSCIEYATLPPKPIDFNSRNAIKPSKIRDVNFNVRRTYTPPVSCGLR
jgi:hypothetical protein